LGALKIRAFDFGPFEIRVPEVRTTEARSS
jgi:hypothetical protein